MCLEQLFEKCRKVLYNFRNMKAEIQGNWRNMYQQDALYLSSLIFVFEEGAVVNPIWSCGALDSVLTWGEQAQYSSLFTHSRNFYDLDLDFLFYRNSLKEVKNFSSAYRVRKWQNQTWNIGVDATKLKLLNMAYIISYSWETTRTCISFLGSLWQVIIQTVWLNTTVLESRSPKLKMLAGSCSLSRVLGKNPS